MRGGTEAGDKVAHGGGLSKEFHEEQEHSGAGTCCLGGGGG